MSSGSLQLQFYADGCTRYRLQSSDDLQQWSKIALPESAGEVVTQVEVPVEDHAHRFFRVVSA